MSTASPSAIPRRCAGAAARPSVARTGQRRELGTHDVGIDAAGADVDAEAAVDGGHQVVAADQMRIATDALRDELGMLDVVRLALDHAGNQDLPLGRLDVLEQRP